MHEHVGKRVKVQGSKESKTGGVKQAWQAYQRHTDQVFIIPLINPNLRIVAFKKHLNWH